MNRTGEPDVAELKAQLAAHAAEIAAQVAAIGKVSKRNAEGKVGSGRV
ncbi:MULTISPECIES: hypothetical protein [Ensifer]|uniref:Uncharacterized protein n=1 Tax=Ensifer canadensis TaxID=555315 RepID=A0AAW4FXI7_9HYPH|nr:MULTISPECIES: hypothetical protein [Ensifer]MBM3095975.1 hypothetical protein [Ensifer canadensis]UBI79315.1 hypothetical protein J3R84_23915 [Ensifer canadensis]